VLLDIYFVPTSLVTMSNKTYYCLFVLFHLYLPVTSSGVERGGQVGAHALGRKPWGRNSTLFAVILNAFLSKNLDQSMLKNAYFLGKTVKISTS